MRDMKYDRAALEERVQQYGSTYNGMRTALASEQMPESIRKYAPQYALALTAARDLDQLGRDEPSGNQSKVLNLLIAAALAETPLKDGLSPGNPVGDLYQRLTKGDVQKSAHPHSA